MKALCHTCYRSNMECILDNKGLAKCIECKNKTIEPVIDHWGNI